MLKLGTRVKFSRKLSKKKEEHNLEMYEEEQRILEAIEKNKKGKAVFEYDIRKVLVTKETQGVVVGVRYIGMKRTVSHWWNENHDYFAEDGMVRETENTEKIKCYLVAINMKSIATVLCKDVEVIE